METSTTKVTTASESASTPPARALYHAPQLIEHGELAVLTKGAGTSFFDGGGYASVPTE
jgi:hypothetical protein